MKRKFRITIKGESYEVEVEEIGQTRSEPSTATPSAAPEAPPATKAGPSSVAPEAPPAAEAGSPSVAVEEVISAPMPGTVISVNVTVGDAVKDGDVLLIMESMKIQNEITAPRDGVVKEIHVSQGRYVRRGERLITVMG